MSAALSRVDFSLSPLEWTDKSRLSNVPAEHLTAASCNKFNDYLDFFAITFAMKFLIHLYVIGHFMNLNWIAAGRCLCNNFYLTGMCAFHTWWTLASIGFSYQYNILIRLKCLWHAKQWSCLEATLSTPIVEIFSAIWHKTLNKRVTNLLRWYCDDTRELIILFFFNKNPLNRQ